MTESGDRSALGTAGVVGLGAAACAACCAGPILGFLAATGIATAIGLASVGLAALVLLVPVLVILTRRRRRARACAADARKPAPVELTHPSSMG